MNQMGITVLLGLSTTKILGNGHVEGVEFKGGNSIKADMVVVAAGIRPTIELGHKAGLDVRRGIVVNDYMETSNPDIFAVGECVQHNGICYGLVAPLLEQGSVATKLHAGSLRYVVRQSLRLQRRL
jgi:nitrite reductase [NAD(P)H] large subunit